MDRIHADDIEPSAPRLELEAELLLQRHEDGRTIIGRRSGAGSRRDGAARPLPIEVEGASQAGAIDHWLRTLLGDP